MALILLFCNLKEVFILQIYYIIRAIICGKRGIGVMLIERKEKEEKRQKVDNSPDSPNFNTGPAQAIKIRGMDSACDLCIYY